MNASTSFLSVEISTLTLDGYTYVRDENGSPDEGDGRPRPKQGDKLITSPNGIVLDVMRRALADYHAARKRWDDATEVYREKEQSHPAPGMPLELARDWEKRIDVLSEERHATELRLAEVVLWSGRADRTPAECRAFMAEPGWESHVLEIDGELVTVSPTDYDDARPRVDVTDEAFFTSGQSFGA